MSMRITYSILATVLKAHGIKINLIQLLMFGLDQNLGLRNVKMKFF